MAIVIDIAVYKLCVQFTQSFKNFATFNFELISSSAFISLDSSLHFDISSFIAILSGISTKPNFHTNV
jgi:hypothetical protein